MVRTGEQLDRTLTVVALLHRNAMIHAHAYSRLGATGQWSSSLSFTVPKMAFEIAEMSMQYAVLSLSSLRKRMPGEATPGI
jgi:hypothetical protein